MNYLFDASWYSVEVSRSFDTASEAWAHYNAIPVVERSSPSPYFDKEYYLRHYPDVRDADIDPFLHFVLHGESEGRSPHPLIDLQWYGERYRIDTSAPLREYLTNGWKRGEQTHPAFFASWYSEKSKVRSEPLFAYLMDSECRHDPNPLFSDRRYRKQMRIDDGIKPLVHYLVKGHLARLQFSDVLDVDHYYRQAAEKAYVSRYADALSGYLTSPIGIDPHRLFDRYYVRQQIGPSDDRNELIVFLEDESCKYDPHPLFSSREYMRSRPDVRAAKKNPFRHYLVSGFEEHASPHPLIDLDEYRDYGRDLPKGIVLLEHYVEYGFNEKRPIFKTHDPLLSAPRIPKVAVDRISPRKAEKSSGTKKIGVFVHAFYPDIMAEFIPQMNLIPGDVTIYITTDSAYKAYDIHKLCKETLEHPFEIRVEPNRGRDIAPMLVGFADRLREVELALHIHTKKSTHYANGFAAWRQYLVGSNLGNRGRIDNILSLFDDPGIGAVAPVDFGPIDPLVQWGGNIDRCDRLVGMMSGWELRISAANLLELPTGSMFWFRPQALLPLLDLRLSYMHFDPELGQVDGTLAHAIERMFFYVVELAGYRWLRFVAGQESIGVSEPGRLLPTRTRSTPITQRNPEATVFTGQRYANPRPRLNLLIPTAERSIGYAGVSEALRLFFGTWRRLQDTFDCRVIATDIPFSNQTEPDAGGVIRAMADDGDGDRLVYVDGTARQQRCLALRPNDIFVAAAWWNAHQARDLARQQAEIFAQDEKRFVYLIQDYEPGFYEWSTRSALADNTYKNSQSMIPVFNTDILFEFFKNNGYFDSGIVYRPHMNEKIVNSIEPDRERENIMLLYMRSAASRNCFEFIDAVIDTIVRKAPAQAWAWRFVAVGEDWPSSVALKCSRIEAAGRLTLEQYASFLSRAKIGLSLMVSPHPSYPPLEMAAAGIRVLTNTYMNKDLSRVHHNISSFDAFDVDAVSDRLIDMMNDDGRPQGGDPAADADWFFDGKGNADSVTDQIAAEVRREIPTA